MLNQSASPSTQVPRIARIVAILAALALVVAAAAGCKKDEGKTTDTPTTDTPAKDPAKDPAKTPETKPEKMPAAGGTPTLADTKGTYSVDPGHSTVVFRAKHFGVSYTYGRFNKMSGEITIDPDLAKSSVSLEIDVNTIFTANKDRDEHLKGPDFFNAKEFPTITFKSTKVEEAGPGKYKVTGDLALHGATKPVTATFDHVGAAAHPMDKSKFITGFHGYLTIKRSDFGMDYMIDGISDEVDLMVSIESVR